MKTLIGFAILIGLAVLAYIFILRPIWRGLKRLFGGDPWKRAELKANQAWLAQLGATHEQRMASIAELFEAGTATLSATCQLRWNRLEDDADYHRRVDKVPGGGSQKRKQVNVDVLFTVSRNIAGMDPRERAYLKVVEELNSATNGSEQAFRRWRASLVWGDGKGVSKYDWQNLRDGERENAVDVAIRALDLSEDQVINHIQQHAATVLADPSGETAQKAILAGLTDRIAPDAGGSWLKAADVGASPFARKSPFELRIGALEDGTPLAFSDEGSLVTIAPPGSGKTQCNVFPNLLTWTGPAIVLDISGEIYERTAGWRAANVGPVFKFSPLEPEDSHKYNPLTFVRSEPDYIWEDSRLLAEMMIVPALTSDPFWENEARTVLTAAIAHVAYSHPPNERPLHALLDILFGGEAWEQMIVGLGMAVDVRVMMQHATSLGSMNEKTLSSVLQTARSSLSAWTGERVARATERSDWDPRDLRSGSNPTIYICIRPNEVDSYLSLLRVFIGQHIRVLTGGEVPAHEAPPILLMLDELPRLRYMAPIDEGLSIGRKYKLCLWMFAQSVGQFKTAYENADGLLGSCAVRVFMKPGGADGLAERISEELGYADSLHDNSRKRLVEAAELAGPAYNDLEIVLATGGRPARVRKQPAHADPDLKARMSIPVPTLLAPQG
ncbi:MAG: type IV secretory system conjugative DNA transfer family protein [Solirubrobacterales bacterium]